MGADPELRGKRANGRQRGCADAGRVPAAMSTPDPARARFFTIVLVRWGGVALVAQIVVFFLVGKLVPRFPQAVAEGRIAGALIKSRCTRSATSLGTFGATLAR